MNKITVTNSETFIFKDSFVKSFFRILINKITTCIYYNILILFRILSPIFSQFPFPLTIKMIRMKHWSMEDIADAWNKEIFKYDFVNIWNRFQSLKIFLLKAALYFQHLWEQNAFYIEIRIEKHMIELEQDIFCWIRIMKIFCNRKVYLVILTMCESGSVTFCHLSF